MPKQSAGVLVYRRRNDSAEVLLAHQGGPFFANKDNGFWTVPKGEFGDDEEPLVAAKREFEEETGQTPPAGDYVDLASTVLKSGKVVYAWAVEGDLDASKLKSNTFSMEWPPRSGQQQEFPEIDRSEWFELNEAAPKLPAAQQVFLERLARHLGLKFEIPEQPSLF